MKTALAIVPAAVILLAGCASGSGAETPTSSATGAVVDATTAPETTSSSTTTPAPTTSSATATDVPTAIPTTFTDVNQTINDPDLKYSITVKKIARSLPWPAGYRASAQAYELVGVEMTWTPSKDYTIPIRKQDFSINTGSQFPNTRRPDRQRRRQGGRLDAAARPGRQGRRGHGLAHLQGRPAQRAEDGARLHAARRPGQRQPDIVPRQDVHGRSRRLTASRLEPDADEHRLVDQPHAERRLHSGLDLAGQRHDVRGAGRPTVRDGQGVLVRQRRRAG